MAGDNFKRTTSPWRLLTSFSCFRSVFIISSIWDVITSPLLLDASKTFKSASSFSVVLFCSMIEFSTWDNFVCCVCMFCLAAANTSAWFCSWCSKELFSCSRQYIFSSICFDFSLHSWLEWFIISRWDSKLSAMCWSIVCLVPCRKRNIKIHITTLSKKPCLSHSKALIKTSVQNFFGS